MAQALAQRAERVARLGGAAEPDDHVGVAPALEGDVMGPVAEPSAPATDGSPVTIRRWPPRQIFVTAPVLPTHTSPSSSGAATHGPAPPRPASAT